MWAPRSFPHRRLERKLLFGVTNPPDHQPRACACEVTARLGEDYKLKTETNCHFLVNQTTLMEQSASSKVSTDITKMFSLLYFSLMQVALERNAEHALVKSFVCREFWSAEMSAPITFMQTWSKSTTWGKSTKEHGPEQRTDVGHLKSAHLRLTPPCHLWQQTDAFLRHAALAPYSRAPRAWRSGWGNH